jgi:hypothetical protein
VFPAFCKPHEFVQSKGSGDGGLLNVSWMHQYLLVVFRLIRFAKDGAGGDVFRKIQHVWWSIKVLNRYQIQVSGEPHTWSP